MIRVRHVALLIETSRSYGRGLLRGIIRYQREHGPWSIFFEPRGVNDSAPAWLESWRGHGILARSLLVALWRRAERAGSAPLAPSLQAPHRRAVRKRAGQKQAGQRRLPTGQ